MKRLATLLAALAVTATACAGSGSSGKQAQVQAKSSTSASASSSPSPITTYTAPPDTLPVPGTAVPMSTAPPPWAPPAVIANGADSAAYVAAAGLPYASEMLTVHYHAHLDITVDGKPVTVPTYLGWVAKGQSLQGLAPLHTHDNSGLIHIENSVAADFVLGQVFTEWGVRFTKDCLGPYCTGGGKVLEVFRNGKKYDGDPTRLVMHKHDEISVEYGDAGKLPPPAASYKFPAGV